MLDEKVDMKTYSKFISWIFLGLECWAIN